MLCRKESQINTVHVPVKDDIPKYASVIGNQHPDESHEQLTNVVTEAAQNWMDWGKKNENTAISVLEEYPDQVTGNWTDVNNNQYSFTPLGTIYQSNDQPCRRFKATKITNGVNKEQSSGLACRQYDNRWNIVTLYSHS
ncbi:MAG: hypothetical protein SVR94_19615 [Pseudomonadota bacterium]|nr:hypothetical protein [Pseudomonadota bacterium]